MHKTAKGKGASSGSKGKILRIEPVSANDVYEFDQRDASHISSADLPPAGLTAKFRSPQHIKSDARASRKCAKNKMLYLVKAVIEPDKKSTSTPCPAMGHLKTKKQRPSTPVPWVELSRLNPNNLAQYAVSPIAVEHNSPNDLSRLSVNSMFDDSAVFVSSRKSDEAARGSDRSDKTADKLLPSTQCVMKDISGKSDGSEKHKADTDSGYPQSDSQHSEFISLSAGVSQDTVDSGKQVEVGMPKADSDCEVVLYKCGTLDPSLFNSSKARGYPKVTSKHRRVNDDVEPSDSNEENSDDAIVYDVKAKSLVSEKPRHSVEGATALHRKPSQVLKTKSNVVNSKRNITRKADKKMKSADMPSDARLPDTKPDNTDEEMHAKPKSLRKPSKKQTTECSSRKLKENVDMAKVTNGAPTNGAQSEDADAEGKCFISLFIRGHP